jgi:hypothetical protein
MTDLRSVARTVLTVMAIALSSAATGCGDDNKGSGGAGGSGGSGGSGAPTIAITSPATGAMVMMDANKTAQVAFTQTNFSLAAPGACMAGSTTCGHVHLLVDGPACNAPGLPYNNDGAASPATAKFAQCATPTGMHTVTLELHHDDHSAVKDMNGTTISSTVNITTR